MKNALASGAGPQARGGEDLPDLAPGEVEIARLSLVNSVHGEVTSLRAKRHPEASSVLLSMVDEYGTEFQLPMCKISAPLTAEEVLAIFRDAEPTPTETSCQIRFSSFFYADLDALAIKMGIKSSDETNDNVEFQVTRKEAAPTGKSKIRQALDGDLNTHFTKESSEAAKQRMRKKLRGETVVDTPTPTSKDYIYAALGTVAFCIALSFTQAGSVLLRNRFGSGELLARAIV